MATINRAVMAQVHDRVFREVDRPAARVQREIKRRTPADTGTARAGWRIRYASAGHTITGTVYNASPVATYLHTGTGLSGPRGRAITPVRADAPRAKPRGSSRSI